MQAQHCGNVCGNTSMHHCGCFTCYLIMSALESLIPAVFVRSSIWYHHPLLWCCMFLLAEAASVRGKEPHRQVSAMTLEDNCLRQLFPPWWRDALCWGSIGQVAERILPWHESENCSKLGWKSSLETIASILLLNTEQLPTTVSWDLGPHPAESWNPEQQSPWSLPSFQCSTNCPHKTVFPGLQPEAAETQSVTVVPHAICHKQEEFGSTISQSLQQVGVGLHANTCSWK